MSIIDNFAKFSFCIEVSADFAEFTSKKDQRISYAVPTSGAIRGLLQAIFWKPAIKYIPRKVEVLNPIRRMDIKKNELKKWCNDDNTPMVLDGSEENQSKYRIQRNNSYIRDVRYRIHADLVFIPEKSKKEFYALKKDWHEFRDTENPKKYFEMLKRRVTEGQHFHAPYLGTRECVCNEIEWIDENSPKSTPIDKTEDLGMMYIDYIYTEDYTADQRERMLKIIESETGKKQKKTIDFQPRPVVAKVKMENGIVEYPSKYDILENMLEQMEAFWA